MYRNMLPTCFALTAILACTALSNGAEAQSLSSIANVDGLQHTTSTNSSIDYYYNVSSVFAYAYARTDYGVNHAQAQLNLTAPYAGFNVSGTSTYQETFTYAIANGLAGTYTPTSVQFQIALDGTVNLPSPSFGNNSYIQVRSTSLADASASSSTTDVNSRLFETSTVDTWTLPLSVSGDTFTTQSYSITGGADTVSVSLFAGISTSFFGLPVGNSAVDFSNTATLSDVVVYDQHGDVIPSADLIIHAQSGGHYGFTASTPEPSSFAMFAVFGITAVAGGRRIRRRK